jgi:hypothetical protein
MARSGTTFKKGQTGNPNGPPRKVDGKSMHDIRKELHAHEPELRELLLGLARQGDTTALKILYDKIQPSVKPSQLPQVMPINTDNPATMANDTLTSVVNGIVGTEDAAKLFQMLGIQQQITETSELRKEVQEIKELLLNVGNR